MVLRKALFAEVYSVLLQKRKLLSGKQLALLVFLGTLLAGLDLFGLALIIKVLDPEAGFIERSHQSTPLLILLAVLGLFFMKNVISLLIHSYMTKRMFRVTLETVRQKYLQYLRPESALHLPSSHQAQHEMNGLVFSFTEGILLPFIAIISESILLVGLITSLLFYRPFSTLMLLLVILPVTGFLLYANRKSLQKNSVEIASVQGNLYKNTSELVHGHTELLLNGIGTAHFNRFEHYTQSHMQLKQEFSLRHGQLPFRILEFAAVLSLFILLLTGALQHSAVIDLAVFGAVAFRLIPAINRIIGSHATMNLHRHLMDFLPALSAKETIDFTDLHPLSRFENQIKVKGLTFSYPGKIPIIKNLELNIPKGRMIGIKGVSGCGKSTLLQILAGLNKPESGEIRVDEKSIQPDQSEGWHKLVAYVPQQLFIAETSILNNVALKDLYGNPDVEKALWCLDKASLLTWVQSLPQGIHTHVGEGGSGLSGGQKQRLVLARALYKGAELFLLDEITNALDDETEVQILDTLNTLREMGKTLLVVSHKSSLLSTCDEVWSMGDGLLHPFLSVPVS